MAVDPGWGTGNDYQTTTNNDQGTAENNNQPYAEYTPEITPNRGQKVPEYRPRTDNNYKQPAPSFNQSQSNNYQNTVPDDSVQARPDNSNQSSTSRNQASSNNASSAQSSSSSASSSSSSSSASSSIKKTRTYTKHELKQYLSQDYKKRHDQLVQDNQARIDANNNKGAQELYAGYKQALKKIKAGVVTKEERASVIANQKDALQQALSKRLGSLQAGYSRDQVQTQGAISALPDSHASDEDAMKLNSRLSELDYQLGVNSNRAYTRYNRAMAKLENRANVRVKAKNAQKRDAKQAYLDNLSAVDAQDPAVLKRENANRLKHLKSNKESVKSAIETGVVKTPRQVDEQLTN